MPPARLPAYRALRPAISRRCQGRRSPALRPRSAAPAAPWPPPPAAAFPLRIGESSVLSWPGRSHVVGDGQQAGADPQVALASRLQRDIEPELVIDGGEVYDAALLQGAR